MGENDIVSSEIRNKIRLSTFSTLIQYSASIFSQSNHAREINKRDINRKGKNQVIPKCK
jgi:hypothetical protein